jgi:hypothetical protein
VVGVVGGRAGGLRQTRRIGAASRSFFDLDQVALKQVKDALNNGAVPSMMREHLSFRSL